MSRWRFVLRSSVSTMLIVLMSLAFAAAAPAQAATPITVTTNLDDVTDGNGCSLREAIDNANAGAQTHADCAAGTTGMDTIVFSPNLGQIILSSSLPNITSDITFTGGAETGLTTGRTTINGSATYRSGFYITTGSASVKITNMTFSFGSAATGAAIYKDDPGTLSVVNSYFLTNQTAGYGGAINLTGATGLTLTGSVFKTNNADRGGALYVDSALLSSLTLTDNLFDSNQGGTGGGAIFIAQTLPTLTIKNGVFKANAGGDGGAIYLTGISKKMTIASSDFHGNTTGGNGGSVYSGALVASMAITGSTFNGGLATNGGAFQFALLGGGSITSSEFEGSSAQTGGALSVTNLTGKLTITSSWFESNQGNVTGGAASIASGGTAAVIIAKSSFVSNINSNGGTGAALTLNGLTGITITSSVFSDNGAFINGSLGGAIYIPSPAGPLTITSSKFYNNVANDSGGAIYLDNGGGQPVKISGSLFDDNFTNTGDGGALNLGVGGAVGAVTITSTTLRANYAQGSGGAARVSAASLAVTKSVLTYNFANASGGALWVTGPITLTGSTLSHNSATTSGSGVYFTDGSIAKSCIVGNDTTAVFDTNGGSSVSGNWWGSPNGPSGDGAGSGDAYSANGGTPLYLPFLTARPACLNSSQ